MNSELFSSRPCRGAGNYCKTCDKLTQIINYGIIQMVDGKRRLVGDCIVCGRRNSSPMSSKTKRHVGY